LRVAALPAICSLPSISTGIPSFERKGDDLYFDQPLDIYTAVLGGKLPVKALDKTVNINI
jgi:DnaJ-class molecular chaperone